MKFVLFVIAAMTALGQPKSNSDLSTAARVDYSGALTTKPVKMGATNPVNCGAGELFVNTAAASGQKLKLCESTDTWVTQGGGGSSTQHAWFSLVATDVGLNKYPTDWNGAATNALTTSGGSYPVGVAELADGGGSGVIKWRLPSTYVSGNLTFWMQLLAGNTSGGDVVLTVGTACAGDADVFTTLTYTNATPSTVTMPASTYAVASFSVVLPMTGCAAGEMMNIRVVRGADSHTGSAYGTVAEVSGVW